MELLERIRIPRAPEVFIHEEVPVEQIRKLMKELEEVDKRIAVPVNPKDVEEAKAIVRKMLELCEA